MKQYAVRSGQNIYDVALTLYGTVEGIFDLLVSNEGLTMESKLEYGMVLNYHEDFVINQNVTSWLTSNNVLVKNGEHIYDYVNMEDIIQRYIIEHHKDVYESLKDYSPDEKNMFWESFTTPRIVIKQQGSLSTISVLLRNNTLMIIDWGDYTPVQFVESGDDVELEHCYNSSETHKITIYGNFICKKLDLTKVEGVYYPMDTITADTFLSEINDDKLNKLIITDEKRKSNIF